MTEMATMEAERVIAEAPYPVPSEAVFGDEDFVRAGELEELAGALIDTHDLDAGKSAGITYLWKAKGGTSKGNAVWGRTQKASGVLGYFCDTEFVVWLAADHLRDAMATRREVEAVLFHELRHIAWVEDEKTGDGQLTLVGHEYEGFLDELRLYGGTVAHLRPVVREAQQLPLFDRTGGAD